MTAGLLDTLAGQPADAALFKSGRDTIAAGQLRAAAADMAVQLADAEGPVALYAESLAAFAAGLLAAAVAARPVVLPAHLAEDYMRETGVAAMPLLTDIEAAHPGRIGIRLPAAGAEAALTLPPTRASAMTFFTSGTTGAPKPVVKDVAQLDLEARTLHALWGAGAGEMVATVSHQHIYGILFRLFWPVPAGILSADRAANYWEELAGMLKPGVLLVSSPAHLTRIPEGTHGRPERIFSSGGPLPLTAALAAERAFAQHPVEVLGSTETGGVAWRQQRGENEPWTVFPDIAVTRDEAGRLVVDSPHADGEDPVAMGDLVELLPEGRFTLGGRADRIVKVEGVRVSLPRVEEALAALPGVSAAAVTQLPDRGGRLGAVVVPGAAGRESLAARGAFRFGRSLRVALSGRLAPAERPKLWRFVDALPANAQGKVLAAELQALFAEPGAASLADWIDELEFDEVKAAAKLELDGGMPWFEGHFPDEPVFPGIAQAHLAVALSEYVWRWRPEGANLMGLKFRTVLRPRDRVVLSLSRDREAGHLAFRYELEGGIASKGRIGGRE